MRMKRGETGRAARVKVPQHPNEARQQVTVGTRAWMCPSSINAGMKYYKYFCNLDLIRIQRLSLDPGRQWRSIYSIKQWEKYFLSARGILLKSRVSLLCINRAVGSHVGVADFIGDGKIFAAIMERSWCSGLESHPGKQLLSPSMTAEWWASKGKSETST